MIPDDQQEMHREFKEQFNVMSDEKLISAFNQEVGNPGWTSSRATYLYLLREEFEKRHYDYSAVWHGDGLSFKNKVALVDRKIIVADEFNSILSSIVKDYPDAKILTTKKYRTSEATDEPDIRNESKPFRVYCDDMFHYQDPDARLYMGSYATREEAIEKCRAILTETLLNLYEPNMKEDDLISRWRSFGDDPWISCPNIDSENIPFSAAKEASEFAKRIIEKKS